MGLIITLIVIGIILLVAELVLLRYIPKNSVSFSSIERKLSTTMSA